MRYESEVEGITTKAEVFLNLQDAHRSTISPHSLISFI